MSITPSSDTTNQAEVAIAVSPGSNANLLAGYMTMVTTQFQLEHATSSNIGTSWQNNARFSLSGFNKFVDPTVGYNTGGTPYFVGLAELAASCESSDKSSCNASLIISKSADGGTTWSSPNVFARATCTGTPPVYYDKPDMKVDTRSSSPTLGKIFVTGVRIDGCPNTSTATPSDIVLTRLTDTGSGFTQDFTSPTVVGSANGIGGSQVLWNDVTLGAPNGDVYVAWVQLTPASGQSTTEQITVAKSSDGGQTFTVLSHPVTLLTVLDSLHPAAFGWDRIYYGGHGSVTVNVVHEQFISDGQILNGFSGAVGHRD